MPAFTYLSGSYVREYRSVVGDKECNDLLQELRKATGDDWLVGVTRYPRRPTLMERLRGIQAQPEIHYTLYADCNGEWQIINCILPEGGSIFHTGKATREAVMNYMLGFVAGIDSERRQ